MPSISKKSFFIFKRDTYLLCFVVLVIILWSNGFNLCILNFNDKLPLLTLASLFLIVSASCLRLICVKWKYYLSNFYAHAILGMFAVIGLITFVNLVVINGLSPIEVLRSCMMYGGLLICIFLMTFKTDANFPVRLNHVIFILSLLYATFLIFLSFFPSLADSFLIDTSTRFGNIRLTGANGMGPLFFYSTFFAFVMFTQYAQSKKMKIFYASSLGIFLWYIIVVFMGRRAIIVLLVTIIYYFLFYLKNTRKYIFIASAVSLGLIYLITTQFIDQLATPFEVLEQTYLSSYEDYEQNDGTVGVRKDGISYYFYEYIQSGLVGFGQYSNQLPSNNKIRIAGEVYYYRLNDLGFFTVIFKFGFLGVILTIFILIHCFKDLAVIRKFGNPEYQPIAMAILLFLIFSIVGFMQIFWKEALIYWTGLLLFLIWRMRPEQICDFFVKK